MISKEEALGLIVHSSECSHSILASKIIRVLAEKSGENMDDWELIGLLHDLDYDQVKSDMSKHGIVAAQTLMGKLSPSALHAIKAHDYRTGIKPTSRLDNALTVADALATLVEDLQAQNVPVTLEALEHKLNQDIRKKPWLHKTLTQTPKTLGMTTQTLLKIATQILYTKPNERPKTSTSTRPTRKTRPLTTSLTTKTAGANKAGSTL